MLRITPSRKVSRGFTLVELLAVIAIVGVLAAIVIPVTQSVRASARASTAASNLRQLAAAQLLYAGEHRGDLTPVYSYTGDNPQRTWMMRLMPYVYPEITASSQLHQRRVAAPTVFDMPEAERGTPTAPALSVGMNWSIATSFGPKLYPLHANPRPASVIMLGEMVERNSDTVTAHDMGGGLGASGTPGFRRSGDRAMMAFCDGHVEPKSVRELAYIGKTASTNPWRWW